MTSFLVSVSFAAMLCVAPLAFYLCWLAAVNRRDRPTVVAGGWDVVGLAAGLSGFLILGGLMLLSIAMSDPRLFTRGDFQALRAVWEVQWLTWTAVFVGYFGLIALALLAAVRGKGRWLSVYNVDPAVADAAVDAAVERAGLTAVRQGHLWADGRKLVEVAPFHGTRHVSVRILCPHPRQAEEIERHLRIRLDDFRSPLNPAAAWFSAVATGSVLAVIGFVGVVAYSIFIRG